MDDLNTTTYNTWRNTPRWPLVGAPPMAVDGRILPFWFLAAVIPGVYVIAILATIWFLLPRIFRVPSRLLVRHFVHRARGRRLAGRPARWATGLLPALLVTALALPAPPAQAAFRVVVPEQADKEEAKKEEEPVVPQSLDDVIEGYGHDVPLATAAQAILPPGWHSRFSPDHLARKKVNWRANGRTVRQVLVDVANQAGARFVLDENAGILSFSPLPAGMRMTESGMVRDKRPKTYVLRKGHMLSAELMRWAKSAGFEVQWKIGVDYPIEADATYVGYLPDVIRKVYQTYRSLGGMADVRLVPAHGNNVIAFMPIGK